MRLIHTADIHLERSFASEGFSPRLGNRRRQSLRQVFTKILERARTWPADAVLIAGDLYEGEYVSGETFGFLHAAFEALAPVPIVIAPGNRDPYVPGSLYATETWPANVHVFKESRWSSVVLADGRLEVHGFAFDGSEISHNPFGELTIPSDDRVHVALGHGSETNHLPRGQKLFCPFQASDAVPAGLRYLALGHYHEAGAVPAPGGAKIWYSGAPEGQTFRDAGMRHYLEVEIHDEDVMVTPVASSEVIYLDETIDCSGMSTTQQLLDAVESLRQDEAGQLLLRLTLSGACEPVIWAELGAVRDALQSQFDYVDLVDRTEPIEDYEALSRENTSLGAFARSIGDEIRTTPPGARQQMLLRARDSGIAAFRGWELPLRGLRRE
jgi:DNA repair protein SbcD/Mre11